MRLSRTPAVRSALRPTFRQARYLQPAQTRLATTGPGPSPPGVGDKGTAKVYNKDGTNPNKNFVYLGLGVLGLGGVYAMYSSRTEKVANKVQGSGSSAR
ncbi:hypothetical protein NEMBOFW57_008040 [Staphylotrichum longicolle]|uniref:Uncharacterized protein n=1 Tax=Staphylotrichum longicolle TaxID=669026 RepID=A0AAD4EQK1_9PEZI|nr:hypothetical protein NEMBOFW57_008040 [Staphylotrichum longicolle]